MFMLFAFVGPWISGSSGLVTPWLKVYYGLDTTYVYPNYIKVDTIRGQGSYLVVGFNDTIDFSNANLLRFPAGDVVFNVIRPPVNHSGSVGTESYYYYRVYTDILQGYRGIFEGTGGKVCIYGNAAGDTVIKITTKTGGLIKIDTTGSTLIGNLIPSSDNTYASGTASNRWSGVHTMNDYVYNSFQAIGGDDKVYIYSPANADTVLKVVTRTGIPLIVDTMGYVLIGNITGHSMTTTDNLITIEGDNPRIEIRNKGTGNASGYILYDNDGTTWQFATTATGGDFVIRNQTKRFNPFLIEDDNSTTYLYIYSSGISCRGHISPVSDNTYTLGSSSNRWSGVYTMDDYVYSKFRYAGVLLDTVRFGTDTIVNTIVDAGDIAQVQVYDYSDVQINVTVKEDTIITMASGTDPGVNVPISVIVIDPTP